MQNSKTFLLVLLGILAAFGPFVTDMYLPGLPSMTVYFDTTASMVQLGITTAMLGLGFGQIIVGPLSDKYGRKLPSAFLMAFYFFDHRLYLLLEYRSFYLFSFSPGNCRGRWYCDFPFGGYRLLWW